MEVNYLYEGKSLTLLKGVLRHSFIYIQIFNHEVEIARWELGDWFSPPLLLLYLLHHLVLWFLVQLASVSNYQQNVIKGIFFFYEMKKDYCLFPLEKDPGGEGAKVVPSTKQLYEGDQSGWSTPKKNNVYGKFMESRDIKYLGTLL